MDPMTGLKKRAVLLPGRSFCKLQLQLCCLVLDLSLFVLKKKEFRKVAACLALDAWYWFFMYLLN